MPKKEYYGLKKGTIKVNCDFCGEDNYYNLFSNLVKCEECGLVYANPRPSKKRLGELYANYYESNKSGVNGPNDVSVSFGNIQQDLNLDRVKKKEQSLKRRGKILDIGCGVGYFLDAAKSQGWNVYGIEPSKEAKRICQKNGIKIIDYSDLNKYSGFFDVITLFHVFEHIENPKEYLINVSKLLKKNGLIMMEVPNINSFNARYQKNKWWYVQDMHLFYFSPRSIKKYLASSGFAKIKVKPKGGFLINQMSGMEGSIDKHYKLMKLLKNIYYLIAETLHLSDCMQITAVKK